MVNGARSSRRRRKLPATPLTVKSSLSSPVVEDFSYSAEKNYQSIDESHACYTLKQLQYDTSRISPHSILTTKVMSVIANASVSFPNQSPVGYLLLEEKIPEMINISKVCFKSSSCSGSDDDKPGFVKSCSYLRIAIHCIRAITPILLTSSGAPEKNDRIVETAVKLLYHCILASEKMSNDEFKKDKENKTIGNERILLETAVICIAAYQVLGLLLDELLPGKLSSVREKQNIVDLCPSPQLERWEDISQSTVSRYTNLPLNKIVRITTQSSLCMSKIFWKACVHLSMDKQSNGRNRLSINWDELNLMQFGDQFRKLLVKSFPSSYIHSTTQCGDVYSFIGVFRGIITSTVASWNALLNTDSEFEKMDDPIQGIMQAYKSLTECASEIESLSDQKGGSDQKEVLTQSLSLRRDAILILLLQYRRRNRGWMSLPHSFRVKQAQCSAWSHVWIKACNLAKKASMHYASYSSREKVPGELLHFHEAIGSVLDEAVQYFEKVDLCYIEYCAYRALHCIGSMKTNGIHNMTATHADAVFCQLPFPYMGKVEGSSFFLAPFYAAVASMYHVPLQNIINIEELEKLMETIANKFLTEFLESESITETNFLKTGYRLLSNLPLFQSAFDFMSNPPSAIDFVDYQRIVTIGIILGEIVAPFNMHMSSRENSNKFLEMAGDAYIRAAGLFNVLEDVSYSTNGTTSLKRSFVEKSDKYMCKCYSIHIQKASNSIDTSRVEVVGKVRIICL